jgi:hypothetical protein
MKRSLHGGKSGFLFALIPAVLFCAPNGSRAAFIAGLDGVGNASTLSGQGITPLGASGLLGWSNIIGSAQFFEAGGDGSMIATTPYDNYTVRYNPVTPLPLAPNTQYSLTFNMGYVAGIAGGNSSYDFSLGTMNGGTYTPVKNQTGTVPYPGNMHSVSSQVLSVTMTYVTGASVPAGNLAIQWGQTATNGVPNTSDFFGFNKVTLDAAPVPEPSTAMFAAAGVAGIGIRRRRTRAGA